MSRAPKQPILYEDELRIPKEYLQFATPREVALYRAEKLKCEKLVEIGAGIGGQTFAFAKYCKKVLALEIDKKKSENLKENLKKLKIENVEVISGDAFSERTIEKIKQFSPEIIFCDTERPEKSERTLEKIKPLPKKILETFSKITSRIAIEIPPFTKDLENLRKIFDFGQEFISLNKQLNRLTLYFNELKESKISAVSLPSKEKIISEDTKLKEKNSDKQNYIFIIDPTIIVAGLTEELSKKLNSQIIELEKKVLVSDKDKQSSFITKFKILKKCKNEYEEVLRKLKELRSGKVVVRYNVPSEEYWKIRDSYEKKLSGEKEISIFLNKSKDEAILCEKVDSPNN